MRHYAYSDPAGTIIVRRVADGAEVARLANRGPRPELVTIRFSADGRWLVISRDEATAVWEVGAKGGAPRLIREQAGAVLLALSPDGLRMATRGNDGSVGISATATGDARVRLEGVPRPNHLAFRPDGRQVALGSTASPAVGIYDVETGKKLDELGHPDATHGVAWRGDGLRLAVGCQDTRVALWDATDWRRAPTFLAGHQGKGLTLAYSRRDDVLASTAWDGTTRLWNPIRGQKLLVAPGRLVAIPADDGHLVLSRSNRLELWELAVGDEFRTLDHRPVGADFSPDGRSIAGISRRDNSLRVLEIATGARVADRRVGAGESALFRPGGADLVTFAEEAGLLLWPARHGRAGAWELGPARPLGGPKPLVPRNTSSTKQWACWDAAGRRLAVADPANRQVLVLNPGDPAERIELKGHRGAATVALSPNGRWAASGSFLAAGTLEGGEVVVWDVDGRRIVCRLPGSTAADHVAFSPDGDWLVVGGVFDYRFYRTGTWRPGLVLSRTTAEDLTGPIAFRRDGRLMAVAATLYAVRLLDPATGQAVATLGAPEPQLISWLRFSPDGDRLAVASCRRLPPDLGLTPHPKSIGGPGPGSWPAAGSPTGHRGHPPPAIVGRRPGA